MVVYPTISLAFWYTNRLEKNIGLGVESEISLDIYVEKNKDSGKNLLRLRV